jgi:23S rRNA (uracil1939-C5)-methyltransferase
LNPDAIEISDLTHDGRGVGHLQGKTCFVEGALPGETVSWSILKSHRQYDEGTLKSIIEISPDRVEPGCPHFGVCGGCQIQHLDYAAQIRAKQNRLQKALEHKQISAKHWLQPTVSVPWNYRRRARLSVSRASKRQSEIEIGFKRRNSNETHAIDECPILTEELNRLLPHLNMLLKDLSNLQRESIVEIEISSEGTQTSICLLSNKNSPSTVLSEPPDALKNCDIWLKAKVGQAQLIYSNQQNPPAAPPGFMQANAEINAAITKKVDQLLQLTNQDTLLDLFCGSGNFSFPQAARAKHVIGIEADQIAVEKANSVEQLPENLRFSSADLFDPEALSNLRSLFRKATAILLDPPRAGAEAVVRELVKPKPKQILYISCHPATFVRDAEILVEKGYKLDSVGLLDMFPQTMHAEVIGHFLI